jgi:hypothetical protein
MWESNPDGPAMISLLKQDSCENRNEIQKDARRGRSIVDGALFIVGLWLLLEFWFRD